MDNYRRSITLQRWEAFLRSTSSKVKIKAKVEQETDDGRQMTGRTGPQSSVSGLLKPSTLTLVSTYSYAFTSTYA